MNFTERIAAFDAMVEKTDKVLRHPDVITKLGDIAVQLLAINATAFLPNIRNGRVILPNSKRESDDIPVLPLADNTTDSGLRMHESFCTPGPRRIEMIYSYLTKLHPEDVVREAIQGIQEEAGSSLRDSDPIMHDMNKSGSVGKVIALSVDLYNNDENIRTLFHTRELVAVREWVANESVGLAGSTLAHEYMHIYNRRKIEVLGDLTWNAYDELWCYEVQAAIERVFWASMPKKILTV